MGQENLLDYERHNVTRIGRIQKLLRRVWIEVLLNVLLIVSFGMVIVFPVGTLGIFYFLTWRESLSRLGLWGILFSNVPKAPAIALLSLILSSIVRRSRFLRHIFGWLGMLSLVWANLHFLHNYYDPFPTGKLLFLVALVTSVPFYIMVIFKIFQLCITLDL